MKNKIKNFQELTQWLVEEYGYRVDEDGSLYSKHSETYIRPNDSAYFYIQNQTWFVLLEPTDSKVFIDGGSQAEWLTSNVFIKSGRRLGQAEWLTPENLPEELLFFLVADNSPTIDGRRLCQGVTWDMVKDSVSKMPDLHISLRGTVLRVKVPVKFFRPAIEVIVDEISDVEPFPIHKHAFWNLVDRVEEVYKDILLEQEWEERD